MRDFFLDGLDVVVRHFNLLRFKFETNYNTIINRFSRIMINSKEPFPWFYDLVSVLMISNEPARNFLNGFLAFLKLICQPLFKCFSTEWFFDSHSPSTGVTWGQIWGQISWKESFSCILWIWLFQWSQKVNFFVSELLRSCDRIMIKVISSHIGTQRDSTSSSSSSELADSVSSWFSGRSRDTRPRLRNISIIEAQCWISMLLYREFERCRLRLKHYLRA